MSNLIPLEDAARMLGLAVDKLNEMRSNSEIFGYKDGTSWKFKMQEIERVADELDVTINTSMSDVDDIADDQFDISLDEDDDDDMSFDLSDSGIDLIQPDSVEDDDEIQILDDDEPAAAKAHDVVELADDDDLVIDLVDEDEVVDLVDDDDSIEISLEEDDAIEIIAESESAAEELDIDLADDSAEELRIASEGDDFMLQEDSSDALELAVDDDDDELVLASGDTNQATEEPADDFELDESGAGDLEMEDSSEDNDFMLSENDLFEDDLKIHESHEDDIDLSSDFESSDMLLDDSSSSDASAVVGDGDSGFLLDDEDSAEIELSGSLMDLAGADDDEMIVLDEPASADAATELVDDDFNLTPLEEVVDGESSGSQIIALEDSDMFSEESAATLLSPSDELDAAPMLSEDAMGDFGGFDTGVGGMAAGAAIVPGAAGALPEQPYNKWQILSLGLVLFLMLVGGMVGYDLARNLWLPEDQIISGGVLPMILNLVGG